MGSSMKLHQFTRGFFEHEQPSLSLGGGGVHGGGGGSCSSSSKRLRPLAPKFITNTTTTSSTSTNNSDTTTSSVTAALDLKSFIRPDHNGPRKLEDKRDSTQVEAHAGGTRWNPTQEQIGILEMLYKGGMRTPNAQQIEQITAQLSKYGKIEGKNVFYWFQNHKARERQKQKRNSLGLNHSPRSTNNAPPLNTTAGEVLVVDQKAEEDDSMLQFKRKQRCWAMKCFEAVDVANNINNNLMFCGDDDDHQYHQLEDKMTLELFPLHPEARPMKGSDYR